jgi:hypothetical protein
LQTYVEGEVRTMKLSIRLFFSLLSALLLQVIIAPAVHADCTWTCLLGENYVLCSEGTTMVSCDVVTQCGGGCQEYDPGCCNYYCQGTRCFNV